MPAPRHPSSLGPFLPPPGPACLPPGGHSKPLLSPLRVLPRDLARGGPAWAGRGPASQAQPETETKAECKRGGTPPKGCMSCPHFSWNPPPAGQTNVFSKALKPVTHSKERPLLALRPACRGPSHTPLGLIALSGAVLGQRRWQAPGSSAAAQLGSPPRPGLRPALLSPQIHAAPQELRPDRIVPGEEGESARRPSATRPVPLWGPLLGAAAWAGPQDPPSLPTRPLPAGPVLSLLCQTALPSFLPPGSSNRRPRPLLPGRSSRLGNPRRAVCTSSSDVAASVLADWTWVLEAVPCLAP